MFNISDIQIEMKNNKTDIRSLVDRCVLLLKEVLDLSSKIEKLSDLNKIEGIEDLFVSRGIEIEKLTTCESELTQILKNSKIDSYSDLMREYSAKRLEIFQRINVIDSEVEKLIKKIRDEIMGDLKKLHQGKKMNQGYLNRKPLGTGFVDFKE